MRWDAKRRRYVDERGRVLTPRQVRKQVEDYVETEERRTETEAAKMVAGIITATAFFLYMQNKIEAWHKVTGAIAYGGRAQMNAERWARIEQKIASEAIYLSKFEEAARDSFQAAETIAARVAETVRSPDISAEVRQRVESVLRTAAPSEAPAVVRQAIVEAGAAEIAQVPALPEAQSLIGGTIQNRAGTYPNAAYSSYENQVLQREVDNGVTLGRRITEEDQNVCDGCMAAATEEYLPLDELLDIGDAECMSNCRCTIEFSYQGVEPLTIERDIYAQTNILEAIQ